MASKKRFAFKAVWLLVTLTLLAGCGWQLRGYEGGKVKALTTFKSIHVVSDNRYNAFFKVLNRSLARKNIQEDSTSALQLSISRENVDRTPLAYGSTGVPAQYELVLSVEYSVSNNKEALIASRRIHSRRFYDFDPDLVIEKDREQEELLNEMRGALAERMLISISRAL